MLDILITIPPFLAVVLYLISRPRVVRSGIYLPDFAVVGVSTYTVGAAYFHFFEATRGAEDVLLIATTALTSLCIGFACGAVLLKSRYPANYSAETLSQFRLAKGEEFFIYAGLIFCGFVCLGFSIQVLGNEGVSRLIPDFSDFSGSGTGSLLDARKAITNSTEGYFAPGYVKQFRDLLVPVLMSAILLMAMRKPLRAGRLAIVIGVGAFVFVAMMLTGVRSNLFLFFVTLFIAYWSVRQLGVTKRVHKGGRSKKANRTKGIIFIVIAFSIYGLSTVLLGRLGADEGVVNLAWNVVANLLDRVVLTVPRENILSYDLWSSLQSTNGEFWLSDLGGALPGSQGATLSNLLHAYLGGSIEGNSVLGLPADVWVNWGWGGLVVFPAFYAFLINVFDFALTKMRSPLAFGVKVTLAVSLVQIYSPFGFLLYGGALSLLVFAGAKFLHFRKVSVRRQSVTSRTNRPRHFAAEPSLNTREAKPNLPKL